MSHAAPMDLNQLVPRLAAILCQKSTGDEASLVLRLVDAVGDAEAHIVERAFVILFKSDCLDLGRAERILSVIGAVAAGPRANRKLPKTKSLEELEEKVANLRKRADEFREEHKAAIDTTDQIEAIENKLRECEEKIRLVESRVEEVEKRKTQMAQILSEVAAHETH